jgi:dTDP-4-amino-4,6-dideoxygalactose transaminase
MDSDKFYNIDIEKTMEFIKNETIIKEGVSFNKRSGKKISALVPVHVWGNACWLDELIELCDERNIAIVEDASESLGTVYTDGKYKGRHAGTVGKLGCLSFNGNKIITSGGGGMILTDDETLAEKAKYLTTQAKDDPIRYVHNEIGYNFRLTNIQAAIGVAQLELLPKFLKKKKKIYEYYHQNINKINGLKIPSTPRYSLNNHWLNLLQVDEVKYGNNKEDLMRKLGERGLQTRPVWYPNHKQKPYVNCQVYKTSKVDELVKSSLCLPSSVSLRDTHLSTILQHLKTS